MTFLVIALVAAACSDDDTEPGSAPTTRTPTGAASEPSTPTSTPSTATSTTLPGPVVPAAFEDVATGFDVPWGLVFLPDGSALLSERDTARILSVSADGGVTEVGPVEGVQPGGEGGLLGLAVAPDSPETVYAYFTAAEDNRVVRMPYRGGALGAAEVVVDGIPKAGNHNGGRLAFGPDGKLYVSTGDASRPERAQDLDSLGGKILRLNPDGSIPADNPFDGSPVFSYGHRNVQGLAFDDDGNLWASEFGQNTWDELNLIQAGKTTAGRLSRASVETTGLWTRSRSGRPTRHPPVASPSSATPCSWRRCAASDCGRSRSRMALPARRPTSPSVNSAGCGMPRSRPTGPSGC